WHPSSRRKTSRGTRRIGWPRRSWGSWQTRCAARAASGFPGGRARRKGRYESAVAFSTQVKGELARYMPEKRCCQLTELGAILALEGRGVRSEAGWDVEVTLTNTAAARKIGRAHV